MPGAAPARPGLRAAGSPHLPGKAAARPPRPAPSRLRRQLPASPRARAGSSPAPPPQGSSPGGGRSALPRGAAPGVASARKWSPEPDRAARAEVGMARRREAPGGRPPRAARAPGAVTPRAGNSETGPAPPPPLPDPLSAEGGRLPAPGAAVTRCAGWPRAGPRWRRGEGRATRGPVSSPRPPRGLLSGASSPGAKVLEPDSGGGLREGFSPPSHGPFPQVCRLSDSGRNSY